MDFRNELKDLFLMQQVYSTLFSIFNKIQAESAKRFSTLTSRQYMTILAILHLPENEATINNIAKKTGTTKQNVKQLITAIEKKGYVEIKQSDIDRRAINIKVTPSGMNEMLKACKIGIMLLADIFSEFSSDELQLLWDLLKKMYRFDGKEHIGFEKDPIEGNLLDKSAQDVQAKTLQEFVEKRRCSRGK